VITADLAIAGAGPAGLAAAAEAAARGVSVVVLDDNPAPGGQYFRQAPPGLGRASRAAGDRERRRADALFAAIRHPRVQHLAGAVVWDAPEPGVLAFTRGDGSGRVRAPCILLATGAVERAVPFPGWTLPGVLTAGGLQNLVKGQRVLPGRRFLVVGNGPLLLVAAHAILHAGGAVVEVAESASPTRAWRQLPGLLRAPDVLRRGIGYRAALLRARVPVRAGHTIVEALGAGEVRGATVAPIDAHGRIDRRRARTLDVDTVVAGFGLVPAVELARLLGCGQQRDARRGGLVPERSDDLETTVPGVFAAGDGAGIGGAELALTEGRLAGLLIAVRLGRCRERDVADEVRRLRVRRRRLDGVRAAVAELWVPPASYLELLTPETVVCRCEDVTAGELGQHVDGASGDSDRRSGDSDRRSGDSDRRPVSVEAIKAATRVTMGRCQGRNCLGTVVEMVGRAGGAVLPPRARPPARPVRLADLLHEPLPPPRPPELRLD
jgi:thioredoxin reductase